MLAGYRRALLAAVAFITILPAPGHAAVFDLAFNSLPTAQGWTYDGPGSAGTYFTATGTSLLQDSTTTSGSPIFFRPITLGATEDFRLIVNARISAIGGSGNFFPAGFFFAVTTPQNYSAFGVGTTQYQYQSSETGATRMALPSGYDPNAINRFEVIGRGGLTSFRVNNQEVLSNFSAPDIVDTSMLYLGDATNATSAVADVRRFTLLTGADAAVTAVPEPTTWAMMIIGFGLVGQATRRRRTLAIA